MEKTGYKLDRKPIIRRNLNIPFNNAIVTISDPESFQKACQALFYFEIDGKKCRALPFDKDIKG
jgi:hypothetical protein